MRALLWTDLTLSLSLCPNLAPKLNATFWGFKEFVSLLFIHLHLWKQKQGAAAVWVRLGALNLPKARNTVGAK